MHPLSSGRRGVATILSLCLAATAGMAASQPTAAPGPSEQAARLSGGAPKFGPPPGFTLFQDNCGSCHTAEGMNMGGRIVPPLSALNAFSPEHIYETLSSGKMQAQASALSDRQRRDIAEFLAGRPIVDVQGTDVKKMANRCPTNPAFTVPASDHGWNGWGAGAGNARFQPTPGLRAQDAPRLKLKWAFGLPAGASSFSQPSIVGGRVFFGSDNAAVYAVDARTGCAYWSFHADTAGRLAPIVQPIHGHSGSSYAVYFASARGVVYALDAHDGRLLWKTELKGPAHVSASAAYAGGRLYVPLTGSETVSGSNPHYECCTSRGGVAAIDADTGRLVWRVESIQEPLRKIGKNEVGTQLWGPSGASVWNTPTVDAKRGLLYVGTGNSYGPQAASTSDSVLALSLETGRIVWSHQEFKNDAFMLGCGATNSPGGNCPTTLGHDWDFGGASVILKTLPNGRDVLLAAGKGGVAIALDPAQQGRLIWRTVLYDGAPPTADGLVLFGGAADASRVYYPLQQDKGGLEAIDLTSGARDWTAALHTDARGQIGAASAMPGLVFTGGWDGILRAVDTSGKVVWSYDTRRSFTTVNGVPAKGGSLGSPGPAIADGMVVVSSGYIGMQNGSPGNVILAFSAR